MLLKDVVLTVEVQESGYLLALGEDDDYPTEMPYGWRCGPAGASSIVVLTTTDTGPVSLTMQLHDTPPPPDSSTGWEPVEEVSLHADTNTIAVRVLGQGDIVDAWPDHEAPLVIPPAAGDPQWIRLRLHCHVDHHEPGLGDRGERHLIQLWHAEQTPPIHPPLSAADLEARAAYAEAANSPVEEYAHSYTIDGDNHIVS
ncbi:conserved hypothetical protein [Frankia sp. AiPs1]|uniref:hypothetical protein n=1 Tax=Frankia sp. AiPa1 TaxID=573492 RepID=UPI00202B359E|nr:hypothetical protein [Frankia sp. AiPa1]MCL9759257.1 hypothetical protein [Frankia sp. AiPa1]